MAVNTAGVERALGAMGTTFRLVRLYPPTHPAVAEGLRQISAALPALQALGTVEWKVGATGLHWHGQHLLARNAQLGELAGLLYARGVRTIQVHPGLTPEHVLALFNVATGSVSPDDQSLGRIAVGLGRRSSQRLEHARAARAAPPPAVAAEPAPGPVDAAVSAAAVLAAAVAEVAPAPRGSGVFRPDALPADVEARRALGTVRGAADAEGQREGLTRLQALAGALLTLRDTTAIAEVVAGLDEALGKIQDPDVADLVGAVAGMLSEPATVQRMVARLGEPRVPPAEREVLVRAVGALAAITAVPVLEAHLVAPADRREPYRAAIRVAADRAVEPLLVRLQDPRDDLVAGAAEFLGLTGSPAVVEPLLGLIHHRAEIVRERALLALAELGARETSRRCIPALKDESALVRIAAARAIGVAGDGAAMTVLARRLEREEDEGVQAEILRAVGRLGGRESLDLLARWAEPGGRPRRTSFVRAAAVAGIALLPGRDAQALIELYRQDKDPAVKRAADAVHQ